MEKAGKWLRNFLTGKREKERKKEKGEAQPPPLPANTRSAPVPVPSPKEKKRWSFRRSVAGGKDLNSPDPVASAPIHGTSEAEIEQMRQAMAVAAATDAAAAAAQAAAAAICLTTTANGRTTSAIEEAAALQIQSVFRSYLARKALRALRGLVKLQALVRGHLVRKQATATLRCIQALVMVQARARAQRIQMVEEAQAISQRQPIHRRSPHDHRFQQSFETDRSGMEENVKTLKMNPGESRNNSRSRNGYSIAHAERNDHRFSAYYGGNCASYRADLQPFSPAPSGITDISPRTCTCNFEEFSFTTAQSSPQYLSAVSVSEATPASSTVSRQDTTYLMSHDYPFYPNYMANTESSRAKARSQSAPKQRPDSYERQSSRRRLSLEGRNIPREVKMQRSSSHVGSMANRYQYPWYIKPDRSSMSYKDSECGSTNTVLTDTNYCRSLVAYEVHGSK